MTTAHPSNYTKGRSAPSSFLCCTTRPGATTPPRRDSNILSPARGLGPLFCRPERLAAVGQRRGYGMVGRHGGRLYAEAPALPQRQLDLHRDVLRYDAGRYWLEDAVVANAALLTRRLMRKYGIPIENVLRHYDVVSKRCPAMWVDDENAWFAFKRQVMEVMEMTKEELLSLKGTGDHPSDWALQAAQWAKENGIFTGDSAGNFGWQQPVTREAVAKLLYEYDQARNVDSGAADMVK